MVVPRRARRRSQRAKQKDQQSGNGARERTLEHRHESADVGQLGLLAVGVGAEGRDGRPGAGQHVPEHQAGVDRNPRPPFCHRAGDPVDRRTGPRPRTDPHRRAQGGKQGEEAGHVRVSLFGTPDHAILPPQLGRMACLEAILRAGIHRVMGTRAMIRPRITVSGLASLDAELCGYQAPVLRLALVESGASEVVFPELATAA